MWYKGFSKKLWMWFVLLAVVLPGAVVWGQRQEKMKTAESPPSSPTGQTYQLINSIFASGNTGTQMESASFQMQGVAGEVALPANGVTTVSSTSFQHQPGFLAAFIPPNPNVFLPVVLKPCEGFFETEPNDSSTQADGPVCLGKDHLGDPDDQQDWFFFDLPTNRTLTVDLSNHSGGSVQLHLYYEQIDETHRVGYDATSPYHIDCPDTDHPACGVAGRYYILIYALEPYSSGPDYILRVAYP